MQDIIKIYLYAKRLALYSDLENERNNIYNELNNRAVTCIFSKTELGNYSWKPMGSFLCLFESGDVTLYVKDNQGTWLPISVNAQELVDVGFDYSYEDPDYVSQVTITVEPFGDSYGFDLGDDGYYVNNNVMINQSYAMCKIVINNSSDSDQGLKFKINQQSENGFDFGMISLLNTDLVANVDDVYTNVAISFQNNNGDIDYSIAVPAGESYVTVKYKKDSSDHSGTDTFKFKVAQDNMITEIRHLATIEQVEEQIKQAISTVYKYKGTVADEASLPEENEIGDVYNCEDTGNNFAWDGTKWDSLAGIVDMSNYYTKEQANANATAIANARATAIADEKIAAIPVNNLLHYKGHVDVVEDLPYLGQPSAEPVAPIVDLSSYYSNLKTYLNNKTPSSSGLWGSTKISKTKTMITDLSYTQYGKYYIAVPSITTYSGFMMFVTDYPEQIKIDPANGFEPIALYDANKPVYRIYYDYDNRTVGATLITADRDSEPLSAQHTYQDSNIPQLKFNTSSSVFINDCYYDSNSVFISLGTDKLMHIVTADLPEGTNINDVMTVGDTKDIYRINETKTWEQWSKAPESSGGLTKAYVELTTEVNFDGVGTDLNTADKTNLLNLAKELVNNPVDVIEVVIPNLDTKVQATYKVAYMEEMTMYDFYIAGSDHNNFFISISASLYEDISNIEMSWAMVSYTQPATMDAFIYNDFTQQINVDAFAWSDKTIFIPEDSFEYSCEGDFEYTYDSGIFKTEELSYTEDQHGSLTITITQDFYNPDGNIMLKAWQDDTYQGFGANDGNVLLNDEPLEEYQHQGYYILPNLVAGDIIKLVNTYNKYMFDTPIAAAVCYTRWAKDEEGTEEGFEQNLNSACYSIYSMNTNIKNIKKPLLVIDVPNEPNYSEKLCTAIFLDYVVNNNHWICKSTPVSVGDSLVEYTFEFDYIDGVIENLNLSSNELSTGTNSGGSDKLSITGTPYSSDSGAEGFTFTGDDLLAIANKVQTSGGQQVSLNIKDTSRGRQYKVLGNAGMATNGVNIELTLEFTIILSGMKFYHYGSCTFPSDNTAVLNCISDDYNG